MCFVDPWVLICCVLTVFVRFILYFKPNSHKLYIYFMSTHYLQPYEDSGRGSFCPLDDSREICHIIVLFFGGLCLIFIGWSCEGCFFSVWYRYALCQYVSKANESFSVEGVNVSGYMCLVCSWILTIGFKWFIKVEAII